MPWNKTCATQYHGRLGLPDKGRAVKGLVVCYEYVYARINDLWDGSLDKRKVRSLVPCCGQESTVIKAEAPQHPITL